MRSCGKNYSGEIAFAMTELLEYIIICYGIATFVFDSTLEGIGIGTDPDMTHECRYISCFWLAGVYWRVNKTSIICIVYGVFNALAPMDKVNIWIFGEYDERVSESSFCASELKDEGWPTVTDILLVFLYY